MDKKIKFGIPGLFEKKDLNIYLFNLINKYPEKFNDDCEIDNVYGSYPTIFNGGRVINGSFDYKDVKRDIQFYNQLGIKVRFTFTNCLLNDDDVKDRTGNLILRTALENQIIKNDVNVGSPSMEKMIKNRYENYFNIIYSTTLCIKDIDKINDYSKENLLIPDYSVNNNFELLRQIKHPENIELLADESCFENCPIRRQHYILYSKENLKEDATPINCYFDDKCDSNYYRSNRTRNHYISIDDIREKYLPLGYNKFKIVGRGEPVLKVIEAYANYFVKPEFRNEIRYDLIDYVLSRR